MTDDKIRLYKRIYEFLLAHPYFPYGEVEDFCHENGWNVEYYGYDRYPFANKISEDGFTTLINGQYTIFINRDMPSTRRRFTLCHEIGHIELDHLLIGKEKLLMHGTSGTLETQANIFSSNILLPYGLAEFVSGLGVYELSSAFCLSHEMIRYRYINLPRDKKYLKYVEQKYYSKGDQA